MSKDYVPKSPKDIEPWAGNLHTEIPLQATTLALTPAKVTEIQDLVAPIRDAAEEVNQKQDDLDAANGILRTKLDQNLPALRKLIAALKTAPNYSLGIGQALGVVTTTSPFDPANYKPVLRAEVFAGYVRLTGTKRGADALNIYTRLQGASAWNLLAAKRSRFPYDDDAPLHVPGTPEVREYRAIGVEADNEVGQPSDIVAVTFGG